MEILAVKMEPREATFVYYNGTMNELLFMTYDKSVKMYNVERMYPCGTNIRTLMSIDNIISERRKYDSTWEFLGVL